MSIRSEDYKLMEKGLLPCFIIDMRSGRKLEFMLLPEEFSENFSASFDPVSVRGRSVPFHGYETTNARSVSVSFTINADIERARNADILTTVNTIKSFVYPTYGGSIKPPKCKFVFGYMVNMLCYIESVGISWSKPYTSGNGGVYRNAEVSIDMTEIMDDIKKAPSADDILNGGGSKYSM